MDVEDDDEEYNFDDEDEPQQKPKPKLTAKKPLAALKKSTPVKKPAAPKTAKTAEPEKKEEKKFECVFCLSFHDACKTDWIQLASGSSSACCWS